MYNRMFDLNGDGKSDATESALEFNTFQTVIGTDEDSDDASELEEML